MDSQDYASFQLDCCQILCYNSATKNLKTRKHDIPVTEWEGKRVTLQEEVRLIETPEGTYELDPEYFKPEKYGVLPASRIDYPSRSNKPEKYYPEGTKIELIKGVKKGLEAFSDLLWYSPSLGDKSCEWLLNKVLYDNFGREKYLDKSVAFSLKFKDSTKILTISSKAEAKKFFEEFSVEGIQVACHIGSPQEQYDKTIIDWGKVAEKYDVFELIIPENQRYGDNKEYNYLYYSFYGWDISSGVVLNGSCIDLKKSNLYQIEIDRSEFPEFVGKKTFLEESSNPLKEEIASPSVKIGQSDATPATRDKGCCVIL